MKKLAKNSAAKAAGLLLGASVLTIGVAGIARYNAFASEILPNFPIPKSVLARATKSDQVYRFSMEVVGGRTSGSALARYQVFETEITSQSGEIIATLQLQERGDDAELKTYQSKIDSDRFDDLWRLLRELEVNQLTDLSPYTENLGEKNAQPVRRVPAAATYRFNFQDGVHDYPTSFEVYAPEHLEDGRYQVLRDVAVAFTVETFAPVLTE